MKIFSAVLRGIDAKIVIIVRRMQVEEEGQLRPVN